MSASNDVDFGQISSNHFFHTNRTFAKANSAQFFDGIKRGLHAETRHSRPSRLPCRAICESPDQNDFVMKVPVALGFKSKLSEAELAQFATNVLTRMKDNTKFSSIQPLIATDLKDATERFQAALQEAADRSRTKIAEKNTSRDKLLDVLDTVATHLSLLAGDEPSVVIEAGFNIRQRGQRNNKDLQPVNGLQAWSPTAGQVWLEFAPAPLARNYAAEWSTDGTNWKNGTYNTACKIVITDLPSRQDVWVRVCTLGSLQRKSQPSEPVKVFVQ